MSKTSSSQQLLKQRALELCSLIYNSNIDSVVLQVNCTNKNTGVQRRLEFPMGKVLYTEAIEVPKEIYDFVNDLGARLCGELLLEQMKG